MRLRWWRRDRKQELAIATMRTSWWRRLLAKFLAEDINRYCARCSCRLPVLPDDPDRDGVCFWCTHLACLRAQNTVEQEDLDSFDILARNLQRVGYQAGRPAPTSMPGPGERVSR